MIMAMTKIPHLMSGDDESFGLYAGLFFISFHPAKFLHFSLARRGGRLLQVTARQTKKSEDAVWMFRWARQRRIFVKRVTQPASSGVTLSCIGTVESMTTVPV